MTRHTLPIKRARQARTFLDDLAKSAIVHHGISSPLAHEAADITRRALALRTKVSRDQQHQAENYFWGVIRRRALRRDADPDLAGRFLLTSVVADLRAAQFPDSAILAELENDWASRVPEAVMNEFRDLLQPMQLAM